MLFTIILAISVMAANTLPVEETTTKIKPKDQKRTSLLEGETNPELSPLHEKDIPDMNDLEEVKVENIPVGSWFYEVEEPEPEKVPGELLETANNIVFRPLFRYREKQAERRIADEHRRYRRRYYVPKRTYRPYRSAYYQQYYPRRYYY